MVAPIDHPHTWEELLSAEQLIQQRFPQAILVGGTAAALHVAHRISLDGDHVLPDLKTNYEQILKDLEAISGWETSRLRPPVLVLGNLHGIETGLRQLRRSSPLETTTLQGLIVPTLAEMLRIKVFLCCTRNATRDYLDTAALWSHASETDRRALLKLDELYPQATLSTSISQQACEQLALPKPFDLAQTDLKVYKQLAEPWNNWNTVVSVCQEISVALSNWKMQP